MRPSHDRGELICTKIGLTTCRGMGVFNSSIGIIDPCAYLSDAILAETYQVKYDILNATERVH